MHVLVLSNFFPPASRGGYEEWCCEVAVGLHKRGHAVTVLTSRHGRDKIHGDQPLWVHRNLNLEMELVSLRNSLQFFTSRKKRERKNLFELRSFIGHCTPDVILIWGMWNLSRTLPALAEQLMPGRVVYYMGDYWPTLPSQHQFYWQAPARSLATAVPKYLLRPLARSLLTREKQPNLQFTHVLFPSLFMRDEFVRSGVTIQNATVIYGAIDTEPYVLYTRPMPIQNSKALSLLYVGRLTHDKGVHTAIEAVGRLVHQPDFRTLTLRIVGTGDPAYIQFLHTLVRRECGESWVQFEGTQPKERLAQLYHEADIVLFTSIWQEPFGRVLIEAMAAGTVVIGAATGGVTEILHDGENALTFVPGDADQLASQIVRLVQSPSLRQRLAANGRRTAIEKFDIGRMTAEIESYLQTHITQT